MTDSSTSQDTGSTVADAADRIASLLGPADSEVDETQDAESSDADEDDADAPQGDDAEAEEGERSDEQDDAQEPEQQPELYTVKVAGEEVQVTLDEALKGYSREQDYTRKTQALAQESKAIAEARDRYLSGLSVVEKIVEASQPKVDQSLRDTNPAEWSAQMLQHRAWAEQKAAIKAEQERVDAERQAEEARARDAVVAEESAKLLKVIPEWADQNVAKAESAKMRAYGESVGFTPDDLDEVVDHRAVAILRDAMRYREIVAKSGQVRATVEAKKTAKPGAAAAPRSKVQDVQRAKTRLRQSGRVDDAAVAIERMLG